MLLKCSPTIEAAQVRGMKTSPQMTRGRSLKNLNKAPMANKNTQFGMILCEESEWKWQWAAIESGTCQYWLGVSPLFTSHAAAIEWMDSQI